jgi:hypothetical protein
MHCNDFQSRVVQYLAGSALLLMCGIAVAGSTTSQIPTTVAIYAGSSGTTGVLVTISPPQPSTLTGCTDTSGNYVFINFSSTVLPTGRDLYASVLAAMFAGQAVAFGTSGCDPNGTYPQAYAVNIY